MPEYGEGYVLKESLIILIEWDNDIEKWVILDDDLEFLMTEKNDVVEVVRCKDCKYAKPYAMLDKFDEYECTLNQDYGEQCTPLVMDDDFCSNGEMRKGELIYEIYGHS